MSQVDGDSDMVPLHWGSVGRRGAQKRYNGHCLQFCLGGSCALALALMPDTLVSPPPTICYWYLSRCCPNARAQREWVWVSPCVVQGLLRWEAWESHSFFCQPTPHWFLQPEVVVTYLPGTWPWAGWSSVAVGSFPRYPIVLYPPHVGLTPAGSVSLHLCPSIPPTCPNSLVVGLPYRSIFWQFWVMVVLYFSSNFAVVVQGGKLHLPTPPSWQEVQKHQLFLHGEQNSHYTKMWFKEGIFLHWVLQFTFLLTGSACQKLWT